MRNKSGFGVILAFAALLAVCLTAVPAGAAVSLYVDAAPNVYGSPAYALWEANAFAAASDGTFSNMANSVNPSNIGTTNFEAQDVTVYSFGDLGKRLTFVYYIPGATIASLTTANFQVALYYDWGGVTTDFYRDYYESTWLTPGSWVEYRGGVIGRAGFAWWGASITNTQAELDADLADIDLHTGNITFSTRMNSGTTAPEINSITAYHTPTAVPEPGTLILLGSGLLGLVGFGRKKFRK